MGGEPVRLPPAPLFHPLCSMLAAGLLLSAIAPQGYGPVVPISTPGLRPNRTVAGDFDGDRDLDLVSNARFRGGVSYFESRGTSGYRASRYLDLGADSATGMNAADFTGDGRADLLIAESRSFDLALLVSRSDGTFEAPRLLGGVGSFARSQKIVDIDLDGDLDIIGLQDDFYLADSVLIQNLGGGVFAPPRPFGIRINAFDVAVFDADLDLAFARQFQSVEVWLNDGQLGFSPGAAIGDFGFSTRQVLAGDLDGDGDADLVGSPGNASRLFVAENLGGGSFGPPVTLLLTASLADIELVDVDRDGELDVVGTSPTASSPKWLRGRAGVLDFEPSRDLWLSANEEILDWELADLNQDGTPDFVVTKEGGQVEVVTSDLLLGSNPYDPAPLVLRYPVPPMVDLATMDLDADGDTDVVSVGDDGWLYVAARIGWDAFEEVVALSILAPSGFSGTDELVTEDLDEDGDRDLVCVDRIGRVLFLENTGTGELTAHVLASANVNFGVPPALADIDGDGDRDVLLASNGTSLVALEQLSPGVFAGPRVLAQLPHPLDEILVDDLNRDGIVDVGAVLDAAGGTGRSLVWFRGTAGGGFVPEGTLVGDLDLAGRLIRVDLSVVPSTIDFLWASDAEDSVFVSRARTDGTYQNWPLSLEAGAPGAILVLGDLRGEGDRELVVAGSPASAAGEAEIRVYRRNGTSVTLFEAEFEEGPFDVTAIELADMDGDGDNDLLLAARIPALSWIENQRLREIGTNYCGPAVPNQTGRAGVLSAVGSHRIQDADLTLRARDLPPGSLGMFLASLSQDFVTSVPGSAGRLCLGGSIGRYSRPDRIQLASEDGVMRLEIDLAAMPQPSGLVPALVGNLWFFQGWHRDLQGGAVTSNFTDALAVAFR